MISLNSVNSLQRAVAFAERKVQQDRDQVAQDENRLQDSQAQLDRDTQTLDRTQTESRRAQAAATPAPTIPRLDRAIDKQVPEGVLPQRPSLNTLGQTIGKLINVQA